MTDSRPELEHAQKARTQFVEPARLVMTKWLTYEFRFVLGISLLAAGFVTTVILQLPADLNDRVLRGVALVPPFLGVVVSAFVLPGRGERRVAFAAIAIAAVVPFILPLTLTNTQKSVSVIFFALSAGLLAWAWMVLRERRAGLYLLSIGASLFTVVVAGLVTGMISPYGPLNPGYPELFGFGSSANDPSYVALLRDSATIWMLQMVIAAAGVIGVLWIVRVISTQLRHYTPKERFQLKTEAAAHATDAQEKAAQQARVDEIRKWETAYSQAHDGKLPPGGYVPPIVVYAPGSGAAERTNTLAILSLIFGLLGGWLGILFGFIALAQIKRTGEKGRGMAIAGIVFAFVWALVQIVFLVSTGVFLASSA